jgi:O-antigen biosynthesis protein
MNRVGTHHREESKFLSQLNAGLTRWRVDRRPRVTGSPGNSTMLATARSFVPQISNAGRRPYTRGKFVFTGEEKLYIRGVTYGPFRPDENGCEYHNPALVAQDFAQMVANGINAVRTYTVPPLWLLDLAQQNGLRVMVGLPWEQHITFLDKRQVARDIQRRVCAGVRACAGHAGVLCYTVGNEIPSSIVRWHGRRRIERFLEELYWAAKAEDPEGLFTYVNYPTTEYLQLPFVDLFCFNVFLESQERLAAYLGRLHNLAGDRPLILAEIGLDSLRHGEQTQARVLDWQVRTVLGGGGAGAFIFNWADEWYRGGFEIEDWKFGLVSRDRRPKPALETVRKAFAESPFSADQPWPRISVVVCCYNAETTLRDCLESLRQLEYPNFEVIVVDDGSTDGSAGIARDCGFRLISTENRGLSAARNSGLQAATGEIVAYTDSDCCPDPHWLTYLANAFMNSKHAGMGGPNIAPPDDGLIAECVATAPGGPVHVLLSDDVAEHIPGCNMAFWKSCLEEIGGFDPQFRAAGDDVDVCWRLQQQGWTLGFSPAAMVWHHRRSSVRAYWRQQAGYGKAEALLERKWPEKYNAAGHVTWLGRVYANGRPRILGWVNRVYHGTWGSAPFQTLRQSPPNTTLVLPLMPEWYLVILALVALSALGEVWKPLLLTAPLLVVAVGIPLVQAALAAERASFSTAFCSPWDKLKLRGLTAFLQLLQPLARLYGRLRWGLTPWRRRGSLGPWLPWPQRIAIWSEQWQSSEDRLKAIEAALRSEGVVVPRGGDYDCWDLEVRGGLLGSARLRMGIEDHGGGKQLVRFRVWPRCTRLGVSLTVLFAALAVGAAHDRAIGAFAITCGTAVLLAFRAFVECGTAMAVVHRTLQAAGAPGPTPARPLSASVLSHPVVFGPFVQTEIRIAVDLSVAIATSHRHRELGREKKR